MKISAQIIGLLIFTYTESYGQELANLTKTSQFRGTISIGRTYDIYFDGRPAFWIARVGGLVNYISYEHIVGKRMGLQAGLGSLWIGQYSIDKPRIGYSGQLSGHINTTLNAGIRYYLLQLRRLSLDVSGGFLYRHQYEKYRYGYDIISTRGFDDYALDAGLRFSTYQLKGRIQVSLEPTLSFVVLRDERWDHLNDPNIPRSATTVFRGILSVGYRFIRVNNE